MRLRSITENIKGSKTAIRQAADALGELIEFSKQLGKTRESLALQELLDNPTPRSWLNTKWIIDPLIRQAIQLDRNNQDKAKSWAELKQLTSPVVVSALYDIDPQKAKGTPLQQTALSRPQRDRFKEALGPQGYISTMAQAADIPPSKLKNTMKDIAKSGPALSKAAHADVPGVKSVKKF